MMIDISDLRDLRICEKCDVVFMPTEKQKESWIVTRYCSRCSEKGGIGG
jgi:hypothetical protein